MIPAVMPIAGGETLQFVKICDPSNATPRTIAVAIAVDCQAIARRKAGSAPRVNLAKGGIALSGPRVRKNRMAMSRKVNSNFTTGYPIRSDIGINAGARYRVASRAGMQFNRAARNQDKAFAELGSVWSSCQKY